MVSLAIGNPICAAIKITIPYQDEKYRMPAIIFSYITTNGGNKHGDSPTTNISKEIPSESLYWK
jgi:hypothetical protein